MPTTSVSFAATFETSMSTGWLHTSLTSGAPTGKTMGDAVRRTTRSGGSEIIPADVRAVPGVVGSDKYVGVFPAFAVSGPQFSAYSVTPAVFGAKDALAPGTKKFICRADLNLDTGDTEGTPEDSGNNVVRRGSSPSDQYKVQVDLESGLPSVTCVVRDGGRLRATRRRSR